MFLLAAVLGLIATVAAGVPMHDGRIVGGKDTTIEEHPHQVSLEDRSGHFCGGSVVAPSFVVSAAHCVVDTKTESITVRAGTTKRSNGGIQSKLEYVKYNPNFSMSKLDGDVSVLKLKTPLAFNNKIKPLTLVPINKEPSSNEMLIVTGWGTTQSGADSLPLVLQMVEVPSVDKQLCRLAYGNDKISDKMICAGVAQKDSCQGDSGGPLINSRRELVGIVSWGQGCGSPGYPGVYGSVASPFIHNFITKIVNGSQETEDQDELTI